jgi:AcrR family transcriptional regulator
MELTDASRRSSEPHSRRVSQTERRAQLIDSAEEVFLENGYHLTTMDDVARRAGMSKKTIYVVFPSKADLFDALLLDRLEPISAPIPDDDRPLAEVLCEFLTTYARLALSPRRMELTRLMIAESHQSPDVAKAIQRLPICRGEGALDSWLRIQARRGKLTLRDSREAGAMLLGMSIGEMLLVQLLKAQPALNKAQITRRIESSVRMFLNTYAVKSNSATFPSAADASSPRGRRAIPR